jgi:hypothetical protein
MAVTNSTSLLGLALPTTGDLSGTWGDTVNNSITSLVDSAVAGTTTLSTDADVTLSSTTLVSNQARQAILLWTAANTVTRYITAPAQSKSYVVVNSSSGGGSIVIRGVGPTTGVAVAAGIRAVVVWNGSDFVALSGGTVAGSNTQVQFNNSGTFGASSALTWDGTSLAATKFAGALNGTVGATTPASGAFTTLTATTAIPVTSGGTGQSNALTQYGVVFASTTGAMATTSAGTAGYVLTANASAAPTFQPGLTTGKSIAMAMIFGF